MRRVELAHTGSLPPAVLADCRALVGDAFDGDLSPEDWQHCLGGVHALARVDGALVAHAALVQRTLVHRGRALRCGYLEGVAVRPGCRRAGHGSAVVGALEDLGRGAYDLLALSTTDEARPLYEGRGWVPWRGPTYALTPSGVVRTEEEDDAVLVLPLGVVLEVGAELVCDWREGDVW